MEDKKKHWVEELFAPRFTAQDFFHETFEPDLLFSEKVAKEKTKKIEGIYQSTLFKLQEDEKQERKERLSKLMSQDYNSAQETPATAQTTICASCQKLNSNTTNTVGDNNRCIWSEHELNLLRHELNKKDRDGTQLKLQLDACKRELSELKAKQKETVQEFEAVRAELAASKRYTECKRVLHKQMLKDGTKRDAELHCLRKELQEATVMLHKLTHSLHEARKETQDLQLQNNDLEYELKTLSQQQGLQNIFIVENMKLKFSQKVTKLREEIESIKAERDKQRSQVVRDSSS